MRRVIPVMATVILLCQTATSAAIPSATTQHTDAYAISDGGIVGDASLTRHDNGVTTRSTVHGADPGVYTLWWIIWNRPEACGQPWSCVETDLFNPETGLAIGYGAGAVVGPHGRLQLTAHLPEGRTLQGFPYPEFGALGLALTETSLLDARHAEVHLVIRSHGPKVPGLVDEMLLTFNGACVYDGPITGSAPAYGEAGPNRCEDRYFTAFPTPGSPQS